MNRIALSIACAACALVSVALVAPQPDNEAVGGIQQALDRAIDDERHAIAFYTAVMAKHGERRPFSNIINAERRHEAALLEQYERLGLDVPRIAGPITRSRYTTASLKYAMRPRSRRSATGRSTTS
jgi:hypothetical protein